MGEWLGFYSWWLSRYNLVSGAISVKMDRPTLDDLIDPPVDGLKVGKIEESGENTA